MREIVELSWARRVPGEARACHPSSTHTCTRSVTAGEHRAQARPPFELPKHDSQPSRRTCGCGCPYLPSYHYASPPKSLNVNLQVDRIPLPNALVYLPLIRPRLLQTTGPWKADVLTKPKGKGLLRSLRLTDSTGLPLSL